MDADEDDDDDDDEVRRDRLNAFYRVEISKFESTISVPFSWSWAQDSFLDEITYAAQSAGGCPEEAEEEVPPALREEEEGEEGGRDRGVRQRSEHGAVGGLREAP